MRIINAMFGLDLAGTERSFVNYALMLTDKGHEVINYVRPKARVIEELEKENLNIHCLKGVFNLNWNWALRLGLKSAIRAYNPDFIFVHGRLPFIWIHSAMPKTNPLISVAHTYSIRRFSKGYASIGVSPDLCRELKLIGCKNVFYIPNIIETKDVKKPSVSNFKGKIPVLGSLGRLEKSKGFQDYIMALHILKQRRVIFKAVLGGDGSYKPELLKLISSLQLEDHLAYLGWVHPSEFYPQIDILCQPSHSEAFPMVFLEAMRYNLPIVTSLFQGASDLIRNNENGLTAPIKNPEALADALERMISDDSLRLKCAQGGWKDLNEKYTRSIVADQLDQMLHALQSERGK